MENQIIINNKLQNPGRRMGNTSQSTSIILTFTALLWSIYPPPSLGISTGVEGIRNPVQPHGTLPTTSPGEGCRGSTLTTVSYQKGQGGASGMGTPG